MTGCAQTKTGGYRSRSKPGPADGPAVIRGWTGRTALLTLPRRQPRRGCSFLAGRAVRSSDVRAQDSSSPRTPSSASPRRRGCESTSARESAPRTSLRCTHRRPRAAIGVAAARALRAPLSADPPRPARSTCGTARISGAARDPGRVGRRNRAVAPATRPGHHRAARRCRRSRPEVPHGPGRRPRREAALRGAKPRPTGRRARPLTSQETARGRGGRNINLIINYFNKRPVEINKDRRADRSVPAETGGRTGSSEPRPVKKTGAPGALHRALF